MLNPFKIHAVKDYALSLIGKGYDAKMVVQGCVNKFKNLPGKTYEWMEFFQETFPHVKASKNHLKTIQTDKKEREPITLLRRGTFEDIEKLEQIYYKEKASKEKDKGYAEARIKSKISIASPDDVESLISKKCNILMTGKAGTGKTTRLRKIAQKLSSSKRQFAVLAPTGIAAKNAGGVTIHSFLKLTITPWLPNIKNEDSDRLKDDDIKMLRLLDVLIIDEISMVRCDLMDQMDFVMRKARKINEPFGGVQLILFGDLFQLMPVVTEEDYDILKKAYKTPYFFSSKVFECMSFHVVNLKKIYRQDDLRFIGILNSVRKGNISPFELCDLNDRFSSAYENECPPGSLRIATHNRQADAHNRKKLDEINGEERDYKATIEPYPNRTGWAYIDKRDWPTDYHLKLKVGAHVMFVKNDIAGKQYVNGTLGIVTRLGCDYVTVITHEGKLIDVKKESWWFERYRYDKLSKRIYREPYAIFNQLPLRLAWCVTVHKSQGLTFDNIYLDLSKSFTFGQVYVALSRCKTLQGIHLIKRIIPSNIKTDPVVIDFYKIIGIED